MAYVSENAIRLMAIKYDEPKRARFHIPVSPAEHERIRESQKMERNHDVTLYIRKDDKFVVIAKHMYPKGLFRAPSGGLKLGEEFETGAKREAYEETGCRIELQKFLLRTAVEFELVPSLRDEKPVNVSDRHPCPPGGRGELRDEQADNPVADNTLLWRSFVFLARYVSGDFKFTDTDEIREVRLASLSEFETFSRIMRSTTIGGLHYRAALHDAVKGLL